MAGARNARDPRRRWPGARDALVAGILLAAVGVVPAAASEKAPPSVRFTYERAASAADCPEMKDVLDAVRARLGFDPFHEPAELTIAATVERRGEELNAIVRMSDQGTLQADRRLVSTRADCSELASAMDLAISIAIDPLSVPEPPPAVVPAPTSIVLSAPSPPVATSPAAGPSSPIHVELALGAAGNTASVAPTLGFFAGAAVGRAGWSVMVEGRADLPRERAVQGGNIDVSTLAGTLAPCLRRGPFGACLLGSMAALRGSGRNLADARQVTTTYLALGARAQVDAVRMGPFALRAQLDLVSPLARTTLKVGGDAVWTTAPLSVALGLAVVARFW